jgi:predicted nucleotidyltransferase
MQFSKAQKILKAHQEDLSNYGVRTLAVFGSIARNEGTKSSDIDILVDFDSKRGLFVFVGLKNYLEGILECEVDLVTRKALHPALKKRILSEARQVF